MANVLGLALKVNADATGLRLDPVERALQRLGQEAEKVGAVFTKFAATSGAAAEAQARTATRFEQLANSLRNQELTAEQYAEAFAKIKAEAQATATVFDRGAQTAAKFAEEQSKTAVELGKLAEELRLGAIEAPVFERALQSLSGVDFAGTEEGRKAIAELSQQARDGTIDLDAAATRLSALATQQAAYTDAQSRAAAIVKTLATDEQKRQSQFEEFQSLRAQGLVTEDQYAALLQRLGPITEAARQAEAQLKTDRERAAQLLKTIITPSEQYAQSVEELGRLQKQNLITSEQYQQLLQKTTDQFFKASSAADQSQLKFNELSGVFAILPGPLGNIAGRLSGLTSAGEGLSRVFSGGLSQGLSSLTASFTNLLTPANLAAAGIVAVGAAATQVVNGLVQLEDRVENLNRLASQLGVSFGFVQTLEEAGNRTGVSVQQLEGSFARLQNTLASGGEESRKATEALGRLGIAAGELADLSQQEQIQLFGERIAAIEDPAQRSAAAIALFGRSGVQLLPFFNNLGQAATDVERFNARISDIDAQRINQLGDAFDGVNVSLRGFGQELLTPFIGITRSISEGLSPSLTALGQLLGNIFDTLSPITSILGGAVNVFLQFGATVTRVIGVALEPFAAAGRLVAGAFDSISQTFTRVFSTANQLVDAFRGLFQFNVAAEFLGTLFTRIADTVSSVVAPVFERLASIGQRVGVIVTAAFEKLASFFASFATGFVARIGEVVTSLLRVTGIADVVTSVANAIGSAFGSAWDIIRGVAGTIGGIIERVLAFAEDWLGIVATIEEPVEATIEVSTGDAIAELVAENKELGKVIDDITKSVGDAISQSAQFGQAGFDAALRYQQGIDALKEKLAGGFFNEEQFRIEAEKARVAFQNELDRISQDAELEIQIADNASKALEGIQTQITQAIKESAKLGQAGFDAALEYQTALRGLQEQFERGVLNEEALSQEAERARREYETQAEVIKNTTKEQERQIENDRKRVESLIQVSDSAAKITEDISAINREISRIQEDLASAEGELSAATAEAARRRIDELTQLQGTLGDSLEAAALGFDKGFEEAFAKTGEKFDELSAKAAEFGQAGIEAARQLSEGITAAQEQARDGILNREAYERQIAEQQRFFEQELEGIKKNAEERRKINEFVDQQLLTFRFGDDEKRAESAQRAVQIEEEIARIQGDIRTARKIGDQEAINAGITRVQQLEQVQARELFIASGRQQIEGQIAAQREQYLQQLSEQQKAAEAQQQKFAEERAKAIEAENQRQAARIRELNTLGAGVIGGADIRTSEGAAQFLQLAASRQDPALIEARLQTRRLTELRDAVVGLSRTFAGPVVQIGGGVG